MKQPAKDRSALALVQRLRSRGYAVIEFTKDGKPQSALANSRDHSVCVVIPSRQTSTRSQRVGGVTASRASLWQQTAKHTRQAHGLARNKGWLTKIKCPRRFSGRCNKTGVRRVNKRPMYIAIGCVAAFCLVVAYVANKRANQGASDTAETTVQRGSSRDTSAMAMDVMWRW